MNEQVFTDLRELVSRSVDHVRAFAAIANECSCGGHLN